MSGSGMSASGSLGHSTFTTDFAGTTSEVRRPTGQQSFDLAEPNALTGYLFPLRSLNFPPDVRAVISVSRMISQPPSR